MNIKEAAIKMKSCAAELASSPLKDRNSALLLIADALDKRKDEVFKANALDMEAAEKAGTASSILARLKYDDKKMTASIDGLKGLSTLPDPIGNVMKETLLDDGLILKKVSVPIGVIGVIFEARPDAMVQVASLCIKSGNCAVLKGGKETLNTNRVLFDIIKESMIKAGLPADALFQAEQHSEIDELLKCDEYVDLLIPRGSNKFVRYIMDNTKIPVMGHSAGICHIFIDKSADIEASIPLLIDAKTSYPAACNAVETLLIHKEKADEFLPAIAKAMKAESVAIRGTKDVLQVLKDSGMSESIYEGFGIMGEEDFDTEYNDMIVSLKIVDDVAEAVKHINHFGSHHTDSILTKDDKSAEYFTTMVDSAGVYVNCSTRFSDGFRYGFGAEVGISTGKLHARGPVGLDGLATYKYILTGDNAIVTDYTSGKKTFKHKVVTKDHCC